MIGIFALLVMALAPALVWAAFRHWARDKRVLRVAGASILPPVILILAVIVDFALNSGPEDKFMALNTYALIFMFELLISIGIAGGCEARFGSRRA
jgi:hypothetical protein